MKKVTAPIPFAGSHLGDVRHVCAFFNSEEEEYRVLLPFIKDGFQRGDKAVHVVNPSQHQDHLQRLAGAGIDTAAVQKNGQFELLTNSEAYLRDGHFDQDRMLEVFERLASGNAKGGFPLSRICCRMDWVAEGPYVGDVIEFESRVNEVWSHHDDAVICTYHLSQFGGDAVIDIMRTHPMVIIGGILQHNPFFVPPQEFAREFRARRARQRRDQSRCDMDMPIDHPANEIKALQRCITDLVSILTLPAIWTGGESSRIVSTLLDVLLEMLHLDLAYARFYDPAGETPIEMVRVRDSPPLTATPCEISNMLTRWLESDPQKWPAVERSLIGGSEISLAPLRLGLQGDAGLIVAGSVRKEFPQQAERLLLTVAANQAAIGLQEARLRSEQKRVASELDQRVAQRTAELAEVNQELRKEISNRRLAEEALRDSEQSLRLILDGIAGLVAIMSPQGEIEAVNRQVLDYFGKSLEAMKGWSTSDSVHPDDLPGVISAWKDSIETLSPYDVDHRLRRADNVYRWFHARGLPLLGPEGRIARWYILLTDIDDRRRVEVALRSSERELGLIVNTIPALAWSARADCSAEFFNQHYVAYVGLPLEQLQGSGWTSAVHPDDLGRLMATWESMMATGKGGEVEARLRRSDGEYRWFLFRTNPMLDESGNILKWYGTNADIDGRKQAEEQLRRSEAFLAEGQKLSSVGNFSWLVATDEMKWSEQLNRIFEFELGEAVTFELIRSRVHPEDHSLIFDMIGKAQRGVSDFEYELRLLMPDRSIKHLHLIGHRSRDHQGRWEYIGAVQDVTQRRLAEEALGKAGSELANMSRVSSLGVLTASMAHEVNQPLSGIITNASTCLRMLSADPPNVDGARETARRAIRDGNRAADVIARLRTLYSKKDLSPESMDLNEATREVTSLSMSELQSKRVILRHELADDLPSVIGDRLQLQQVILNLLRNAADAMSGVEDRPRELLIKTECDEGDRIRLSVKDAGVGFAPQAADKLFEAFFTTKSDGMGIGLSVSRSIIEAHRGRLWATPNSGPGATFLFSIPRRFESSASAGGNRDV